WMEAYTGDKCAHPYGVMDHNVLSGSTFFELLLWVGQNSPAFAVYPCAVTTHQGLANNFFIEDNTITEGTGDPGSTGQCSDAWGNAAFVVRFNTGTNCYWSSHGASHSGGPSNRENYGNTCIFNANSVAGIICYYSQGSGEMMIFNNKITTTLAHSGG